MDEFGFCHLTCVPVRAEASERSEMVNQLLFGETFEVVDAIKGWRVIRSSLDKYEGFIDEKQFLLISAEKFTTLNLRKDKFAQKALSWVFDESGLKTLIMPASSMGGFDNGELQVNQKIFTYSEDLNEPTEEINRVRIVNAAELFLNAPYLWGGRSMAGIDCSGLVQNVFKINGIKQQRDASDQAGQGETLNLISEANPGDLAFFDNDEGQIIHVGIIATDGKIIHASGQVRIDNIDHNGIYNQQLKKYTHKLRLIKKVI